MPSASHKPRLSSLHSVVHQGVALSIRIRTGRIPCVCAENCPVVALWDRIQETNRLVRELPYWAKFESHEETSARICRICGSGWARHHRHGQRAHDLCTNTYRGWTGEGLASGFRGRLHQAARVRAEPVCLRHCLPREPHSDQRESSDHAGPSRGASADRFKLRTFPVKEDPEWRDETGRNQLYDIEAKAPGEGAPTMDEARQMLQTLLAERFQLKLLANRKSCRHTIW